ALDIGRGDRVVLPANAFIAALEAVHHIGATPVLCDVEADGFGPDCDAVAAALPARAVLVVHLYGCALALDELRTRCDASGAALIEDSAPAPGARRGGRFTGTFGTVGCFSAGVVKNLGAYGDAGFVTTDDAAVAEQIGLLQRHGQRGKNQHVRYGWNFRLDKLQAPVPRIKFRSPQARNHRHPHLAPLYPPRPRPPPL